MQDTYQWLEDVDSLKTRNWVREQNRAAREMLAGIPTRNRIAKRVKKLSTVDTVGIPRPKNGRYFIFRRSANENLGSLYVREGLKGRDRKLIDQNLLSKDRTTVITNWSVSHDGKLLAYALSERANDQKSIHVMSVDTGKKLKDHIPADWYPSMHSQIKWNPNGEGFWYARRKGAVPKGEEKLHQKIYYHRLGDHFKKDKLIFGQKLHKDVLPIVSVSDDGRYLLISTKRSSGMKRSYDMYLADLYRQKMEFVSIVKNKTHHFSGWMHRDTLYVFTNDHAPNWKLMAVPLAQAVRGMVRWKTVIPEGDAVVSSITTVRDHIFVGRLENVQSVLHVYDLDGKHLGTVPLPALGTITNFGKEPEGNELFIGFTSFVISSNVYRYDLAQGRLELFSELKRDFDVEQLKVEQVWFHSKDGVEVPMFLLHKKGMVRNGKSPALLYGYGGFDSSETPDFNSTRIPFIESGGIYAIANIRGGGEFGDKWHKSAIQKKKQKTFDDFIAAAEFLIERKYTSAKRLAIVGGSNGGLLMGAVMTQRPELFRAVVARVRPRLAEKNHLLRCEEVFGPDASVGVNFEAGEVDAARIICTSKCVGASLSVQLHRR